MNYLKKIIIKIMQLKTNKNYDVTEDDYNADKYWNHRHEKYGTNIKGVGNAGKTEDENYAEYESAKYIFLGILNELNLLKPKKVFELGYGIGFYTKLMGAMTEDYIGVDIVNTHVETISKQIKNNFSFLKNDIGQDEIDRKECDLIYMIDVSQHIVNDEKLSFCLNNNIQDNMKMGGVFIVTDELSNHKYSYYEKSRDLEFYQNNLNKCELIKKPIQFRDKYIFVFKRVK